MLRLTSLLFLALTLSAGASAQSLYKCRIDGKLTYSSSPCKGTTSTPVAVPDAPPPPRDAELTLKRQKTEAARLQKERESREAIEQGEQSSDARLAELRRQRCATAASPSDPATPVVRKVEEKVDRAADEDKEKVRRDAERTAGAEDCPD
jgi:hypothetical protein